MASQARKEYRTLEQVRDTMLNALEKLRADAKSQIEALKEALQGHFNLFLAQTWRSDTPIRAEEFTPALLCESMDTIRAAVQVLQENTPDNVRLLYEGSVTLLENAVKQGFQLPAADEKLALLKACSEEARSAAATP